MRAPYVTQAATAAALALLATACRTTVPQTPVPAAERDPEPLGVPFERYHVRDALGRPIIFYLDRPGPGAEARPLVVFVQGSGCHSLFRRGPDGRIQGLAQNLLLAAARDQARVLAVEKPGVAYLDDPGPDGTTERCSVAFLEQHTLPAWAATIEAAIQGARALPGIAPAPLLVVGPSEGGIVAAEVAARLSSVTHVAILGGNGPTQLFDLVEVARAPRPVDPGDTPDARERRVRAVYETWARIQADPTSATRFAWGHPYRRWASFLATSTLDELGRSRARVFLGHGSRDAVVPVAAFDVLAAELARDGRPVTAERMDGADHGFRRPGDAGAEGLRAILGRVVDWFLAPP